MLIRTTQYPPKDSDVIARLYKDLGTNDLRGLPPNVQVSSQAEFWHYRTYRSFDAEVYIGQIPLEDEDLFPPSEKILAQRQRGWISNRWGTLMLFYVAGGTPRARGGFAVVYEYSDQVTHVLSWTACQHKFSSTTIGRCLTRYTCEHCGTVYEIDSSD